MKTIVMSFCFVQLSIAQEVINVAEYGVVPGKDVTLEINQLIASQKGNKDITLSFPKGDYLFYPENAIESYRAVTNHDNSLKKMAFPLFDFEGITIEGNNSTFIFHGRLCPIIIDGSKNTTLKNFSIDWEIPFQSEFEVIENDEANNSFVVKMNSNHAYEIVDEKIYFQHYDWLDPIGQNTPFDSKTKAPIWNSKPYSINPIRAKAKDLGDGKIRFKNATRKTPPVGTVMVNNGPQGTNRLVQAIHLENATDTYIENVTVLAAGGMALIAERCENIHLNGFKVTSKEGRTTSSRADATHFLGCKGLIKLENCILEHMLDDGINVHGAYVKVDKYVGENKFLCEISHHQQWGLTFAEAGDNIMITSRETILPVFETSVKDVEVLNEKKFLITLTEVPEKLPEGLLSLENITWNPDLLMQNNTIRENRARSVLVTTKGSVLIENNYFSSQMHGILIEGDNNKWYESGGVRDITIRNNVFENIGYGSNTHYPLYVAPLLRPEQRLGDEKYHRNINFVNNTIKSFNGHLLHALSVHGLLVKDNTIELNKKYPAGQQSDAIQLEYVENVKIEKNKFKGFSWPIIVAQKGENTNLSIKRNKGVSKK
ncbi:right-handed parallel beta-helix repeat-containing protein [Flavicella marina]|uniref:right-handed parallel beta-helix repeat-containing protein n=1 Tax=Flavicella marina TaxID=1475951 RepID=UPI001D01ADF4|nr:right-handed parallel beta-helix repeat-containing protein [Flavicella marina]